MSPTGPLNPALDYKVTMIQKKKKAQRSYTLLAKKRRKQYIDAYES